MDLQLESDVIEQQLGSRLSKMLATYNTQCDVRFKSCIASATLNTCVSILKAQPSPTLRRTVPNFFIANSQLLPVGLPLLMYVPTIGQQVLQQVDHYFIHRRDQIQLEIAMQCYQVLIREQLCPDQQFIERIDTYVFRIQIMPHIIEHLNAKSSNFAEQFNAALAAYNCDVYSQQAPAKNATIVFRSLSNIECATVIATYLLHYNHALFDSLLSDNTLNVQHVVARYCDNSVLMSHLVQLQLVTTVDIEEYRQLKQHGFV